MSASHYNICMKQLFAIGIAMGLLVVLSGQLANAKYGDGLHLGSQGSAVSDEMLGRCGDLKISRVQCNQVSILQAERMELATNSKEKGSGTSMITDELGQMVAFIGGLGAVFGGIAAAFYLKGRRTRQIPA